MNKTTVKVRVTRRFEHSSDKVYNAWLIPQEASKFLFATPTGRITTAEIDPRVGGKFKVVDQRDGEYIEHSGRYVELSRPKRIVFAFCVPKYTMEETLVRIELNPAGKGCELTLTHEGVRDDYAERTREGWTKMLDGLETVLRA